MIQLIQHVGSITAFQLEVISEALTSNKLGSEGLRASSSDVRWGLPCLLNASTGKPYMCRSTVPATKVPVGW